VLDVSGNSLSGEIPSFVCELPMIEVLDLHGNSFTGGLPVIPRPGHGMANLIYLDVSHNKLSGRVPSSVAEELHSLRYLSIEENFFWGPSWTESGDAALQAQNGVINEIYNTDIENAIPSREIAYFPRHGYADCLPQQLQSCIDSERLHPIELHIRKAFIPRPSDDLMGLLLSMGYTEDHILQHIPPGSKYIPENVEDLLDTL